MKSGQRAAPLWVMPCLESHFRVLANAEHVKQNCQLFNMNRRMYGVTRGGGQGLTKPRAYRSTTLMWVCGPAELSKVQWVICKTPPSPLPPPPPPPSPLLQLYRSFTFSLALPPSHCWTFLPPLCPAEFPPLTHAPSPASHIHKQGAMHKHRLVHARTHARHTARKPAPFVC